MSDFMNVKIRQLSAVDFDEAIEVMNHAFFVDDSRDFRTLLPKLYRATDELMSCNYAAVCDGRIRAIVGMFPLSWCIDDTQLRMTGIGGVCTHPEYRKRGLMQKLMPHCLNEARSQGYHLSWLGGQRQRYAYFGYETCGTAIQFTLNRRNIRHTAGPDFPIRFEVIEREDGDRLQRVCELHSAQAVRAQRSESELYPLLISWGARPHAALLHGDMVGYVVIDPNGTLDELVAEDDDTALAIVRAWVEHGEHSEHAMITLRLGSLDGALLSKLADISEDAAVTQSGNWQVFDWVTVIQTLLKARLARSPLVHGAVKVSIEGYGVLEIEVSAGGAGCRLVSGAAALQCDSLLAHRLLFGPLRPSEVMQLPMQAQALEAWCPLPLYWERQDGV
jgi:predicted N-acetyltransferase YhbS